MIFAGSGQNDHWSEVVSEVIEPVAKTWQKGMEVQSTGDLVSKVNQINDMELGLNDEVDLEHVDRELENQEKEAEERYNNFDDEQTFRKGEPDATIPNGWKTNPELMEDRMYNKE